MKKRIKQFFLLVLLGIIGYLVYSNYTIRGTWIKAHQYDASSDDEHSFFSPSALSFSAFEIQTFEPNFEKNFTSDSYVITGETILSSADVDDFPVSHKMPLKHVDSDSIVFEDVNIRYVYRKVPDSLKEFSSINISNKLFEMKIDNLTDTSYFTEKDLFIKSKTSRGYEWSNARYHLVSMNGFQLLGGDFGGPVFAVKKVKGKYRMYGFSKDSIKFVSVREIPMTPEIEKQVEVRKKIAKEMEEVIDRNR